MKNKEYLNKLMEESRNQPAFIAEQALIHFTNSIVEAMEYCDLNRSQLAEACGLDKAQITRILSGDHNLTVRTMGRIAAAFGKRLEIKMPPASTNSVKVPIQFLPPAKNVFDNFNAKEPIDDTSFNVAA